MTSGLCPSIPPFLTGLMGLSVWLAFSPKPPLLFPKLVLCHSCHRQLRLVILIAGTTGALRIISCVTSAPASLPIHFLSICSLSIKTCIIRLCNSGPASLLYIMRTFAAVCSWQTSYRCIMRQLEQLLSMDDTGSTRDFHLRHALSVSSSGTPTIVGCCIRQFPVQSCQ